MRFKHFLYKAVSALAVATAALIGIVGEPGTTDHTVAVGGGAESGDMGWG